MGNFVSAKDSHHFFFCIFSLVLSLVQTQCGQLFMQSRQSGTAATTRHSNKRETTNEKDIQQWNSSIFHLLLRRQRWQKIEKKNLLLIVSTILYNNRDIIFYVLYTMSWSNLTLCNRLADASQRTSRWLRENFCIEEMNYPTTKKCKNHRRVPGERDGSWCSGIVKKLRRWEMVASKCIIFHLINLNFNWNRFDVVFIFWIEIFIDSTYL